MPYQVHTHLGAGTLCVIVETAREALAKAARGRAQGGNLQGSARKRSGPRCGSDYGRN
jgi:hypothetical protein